MNNLESTPKSVTPNLRKKCNLSEVLILCGLLEGKMAGGQGFEPFFQHFNSTIYKRVPP